MVRLGRGQASALEPPRRIVGTGRQEPALAWLKKVPRVATAESKSSWEAQLVGKRALA